MEAGRGTKRKFTSKSSASKFYAVRAGHSPGIFHTWNECQQSINGFPKAVFKSFSTLTEAQNFVENRSGPSSSTAMEKPHKWYAVQNGKTPGVYKTWDEVQEQIRGFKGARHKAFDSKFDAECFAFSIQGDASGGHLNKKQKIESTNQTTGDQIRSDNGRILIYTDGSSLANGQLGAVGGVGVYFGPNDPRNISEALPGVKQTNQRAELTAILRALQVAPTDQKLTIISDSKYAISCATEWFQKWQANGWTNASNKAIENKDLVQKLIATLEDRFTKNQEKSPGNRVQQPPQKGPAYWERGNAGVLFEWVKGHAKDAGNNAADQLAVAAAMEAKELLAVGDDEYS